MQTVIPAPRPATIAVAGTDAVVPSGSTLRYPPMTKDVHHEIELVVAIGKAGANVPVASALDLVFGYGVGLDMTRRDLQAEAKKLARPWELGKSFDESCPVTALVPAARITYAASEAARKVA